MISVSVCIVTYNSAAYIRDCLDAVSMQSYAIKSVVIVDNASTDNTVEIIRNQIIHSLQVTLVENKINNGFAGGQNQAIRAAEGDYVLVLNPDVRLDAGYVEALIEVMEMNPLIGSATGQLLFAHDPSIIDSAGLTMGFTRQAVDRGAGRNADGWQQSGEVFGVSGAAALYRRAMIDDVSLEGEFFDEHFFAYKEDVDVAWRARSLGWISYYVPEAKALHARGWKKGGRRHVSLFVRQHSYMNQWFTVIKNENVNALAVARLPAIVAKEVAKLGYLLLREPDVLKCMPKLLQSIPSMLRKRKLIRQRIHAKSSKMK